MVDSVVGRARNVGRAVSAAPESVYSTVLDLPPQRVGDGFGWPAPNKKALIAKGIDQLGDGRRSMVSQLHGEHVPQFDSAEVVLIHRGTIARRYDTDGSCR